MRLLLVLFILLLPTTVWGGFSYNAAPTPAESEKELQPQEMKEMVVNATAESEDGVTDVPPAPAVTLAPCLNHLGRQGDVVPALSRGNAVPIAQAIPIMMPGWTIYLGSDDLAGSMISWGLGESWTATLQKFCSSKKAQIDVNWGEGKLFVYRDEVEKAVAEAVALQSLPTYSLHPGGLKRQLEDWGKQAGYQVVWNSARDWEIAVNADLRGNFDDVVRRLFDSYSQSGAPLRAIIHTMNRVLEVRED